MPEEPKLKLRIKAYIIIDGIEHDPGDVIELGERAALGLIGEGEAEQIPEGQPAEPEAGTAEQVAEATHPAETETEDPKKSQQLEEAAKEAAAKKKQQPVQPPQPKKKA